MLMLHMFNALAWCKHVADDVHTYLMSRYGLIT